MFGKNILKIRPAQLFKGNAAMLPQDPKSLFVKTTVREELEEMLGAEKASWLEREVEVKGFDNVPLDEKILEVAQKLEIEKLLKCHPYDISVGEQQRVALAKVLLTEPKLLLLDEPTKGLDCFLKDKLAEILKSLSSEGVTILMASHDIEFTAGCSDYVGMLFGGGLVSIGSPGQFFSRNSFYTTAPCRMAGKFFPGAVTKQSLCSSINKSLEL